MKKNYLLLPIFFLSIFACQKNENSNTETIQKEVIANKTEKKEVLQYHKNAFYFNLPDSKGGRIDLANYQNRPVLVKFFTRDCPYCQKAAPYIESLYEKYNTRGLSVIGISISEDKEDAIDFVRMFNLKYPVGYEGGEVAKKYGIRGVPFFYLLNKNHELVQTWPGYDSYYNKEMEREIEKLL